MKKFNFTKMVGSGNDFVVCGCASERVSELGKLAQKICDRKYGIGADGLLVLEKSRVADIRMRIFNADGSEAEMCGNGARCAAYVIAKSNLKKRDCFAPVGLAMTMETKAGIINAKVRGNLVKIKLTDPKNLKLDIPLIVNGRPLKVNFINSGVPHVVVFVKDIDGLDVNSIGRNIRYHKKFAPAGTNVNFVEIKGSNLIQIRTYERGVEDETLACGTGSVASAIIATGKLANWQTGKHKIKVITQSKEILKVHFIVSKQEINNVWLEGSARVVYKGEYYV